MFVRLNVHLQTIQMAVVDNESPLLTSRRSGPVVRRTRIITATVLRERRPQRLTASADDPAVLTDIERNCRTPGSLFPPTFIDAAHARGSRSTKSRRRRSSPTGLATDRRTVERRVTREQVWLNNDDNDAGGRCPKPASDRRRRGLFAISRRRLITSATREEVRRAHVVNVHRVPLNTTRHNSLTFLRRRTG